MISNSPPVDCPIPDAAAPTNCPLLPPPPATGIPCDNSLHPPKPQWHRATPTSHPRQPARQHTVQLPAAPPPAPKPPENAQKDPQKIHGHWRWCRPNWSSPTSKTSPPSATPDQSPARCWLSPPDEIAPLHPPTQWPRPILPSASANPPPPP